MEYQVWHLDGDKYRQVATVESRELLGALMRTIHGFMGKDWPDIEGVTPMPGEHRSTTFGDIIIDPGGREFKFSEISTEFGPAPGFEPTTAVRDQGYSEWLEALPGAPADEAVIRVGESHPRWEYGEGRISTFERQLEGLSHHHHRDEELEM